MQPAEAAGPWVRRAEWVAAALFAALLGVFALQIVARWVFQAPLPYTDELAVVLYLWLVLWCCAAVLRLDEHVAFDSLHSALGPRGQRALQALQALLLGSLCAWALPASWDYINFMRRESTPVLGWSLRWVFAPFVLLLSCVVLRCAVQLWRSVKGRS